MVRKEEDLKKMTTETQNFKYCTGALTLKKSLEESYLTLGEYLYNIKEKELYMPQWPSWEVFSMELKMSSNAINKLIQIYSTFILQYKVPNEEVITAGGWSVIAELLPVIETKEDAVEWLDKAKELTREDLRTEIKEAKTGIPQSNCKHKNTYTIVVCRDCGLKIEDHENKKS